MISISLPTVDEHLSAAPSADHFILAHNVRPPSVGVRHVVCAIVVDQQDVKHGIPREVLVEWIQNSMARTKLYIESMVANFLTRLKEIKDCIVVVV